MSIPRTSTHRPVAVAMLFLAVILLGVISFTRLPVDLLPDVSYPRLVVYTGYADVAPAEVERLITERVEAQVVSVPGVEGVSSVSREGLSLVTVRFQWGTDMDFALLNVREKLDNIRGSLPTTAERPRILRVDPESDPIMVLNVAGRQDLWQLKDLAETVFRRRLEQLDGVAQAEVAGGEDREIVVEVQPELLESYGVTIDQIANALEQDNYSAPGGTIMRGNLRYPLRTLGEFRTVPEIADVVVTRSGAPGSEGGGGGGGDPGQQDPNDQTAQRLIRISDIGRVIDGFRERESITRYGGSESVGILVFKESGANTVQVAEAVDDVLNQLRGEYDELEVDVAYSQAGFISGSISNVVSALVLGGLFAFLVLFFFLRDPRYPVAISLAIPISVVGTFALMQAAGVSLNIMSLGGLALGVGMLVDNSIVVLENIFRHREAGIPGVEAAAIGAEEVQGAITASTLTTISVFGPIIYVRGVAGELFGDLSYAVAFSLIASLLVALTLLPTMSARFSMGKSDSGPYIPEREPLPKAKGFFGRIGRFFTRIGRIPGWIVTRVRILGGELLSFWWSGIARVLGTVTRPVFQAFDRAFDRFADRYHRVLEWSLNQRAVVLGISFIVLAGTIAVAAILDRDLLPDVDQGTFNIRIALPEGTGLERTTEVASAIEQMALDDPDVAAVFSRIGRDVRSYAESEEVSGLNTAVLQVRLAQSELGHRVSTEDVLERMRPFASQFPSTEITFETGQATALGAVLGGEEADIAVRIRGEDLAQSFGYADEVVRRLQNVASVSNVRVGSEQAQPQIQVEVNEEATARYGINSRTVANTIDQAMRGALATEFLEFDRKIPVMVRLPDELRFSIETLETLRIDGVPFRELGTATQSLGPVEVHREDQARVVLVYADVISGGLDQAIADIETSLTATTAPRNTVVEVGGENEEMRRSFQDLALAFGLALILVYMILAAQFESFVHPFTILISVPLALVGAVAALWITGEGINTMSLIGVVILVGIVVNDAIVKVDFINQAIARGLPTYEAILEAGSVRLRPIVMTTVTTVLGLFPMAVGLGEGADLRAPLAIAVIGGLTVATALTLIVVPVVYSVIEEIRVKARGDSESTRSRAVRPPGAMGSPSAEGAG